LLAIVLALGWPIWPLLLASVVVLAIIIERSIALRRGRAVPENLLRDVLLLVARRQVDVGVLERLAASSSLGFVLAAGLRASGSGRAAAIQSFEVAGSRVAHDLARNLTLLGALGSIAPLLGLLGTVAGMIEIFAAQQGAGSPQQLAQGISVALYSTAFGIIVAVPAVLAHRIFRARVEDILVEVEQQSQRLLEALPASA
jgi:biopolymer transport protein ExbB